MLWPTLLAVLYPILIGAYAFAYMWCQCLVTPPLNFGDSLYFSVVTITTLGYGDILPKPGIGQILAASEAVTGVVLMGLFLTSLAVYVSRASDHRRKNAYRKHFVRQYAFFKMQMVGLCVDAVISEYDRSVATDRNDLFNKLMDPKEFKKFFTDNDLIEWQNLQNGMQRNEGIVSDMYLEFDLLIQQIGQLLAMSGSTNEGALSAITAFYKDAIRRRDGRHTQHDPAKYFSTFVFGVLADEDQDGVRKVNEEFMRNINAL